jgi:hypothetical protein
MSHSILLDDEVLQELEVTETYRGGTLSLPFIARPLEVSPRVGDDGTFELRFRYELDDEVTNPPETMGTAAEGPLTLVRGKRTGKINWLRVPPGPNHTPISPEALAERLTRLSEEELVGLKRTKERLNFRLIANILRRFSRELAPAG